jgi:large subunit ribosomal protein L7/L12
MADEQKMAPAVGGASVPEKFKSLVSEVEKLSALDLAELVKVMESHFGVSAAAPMMAMAPGAAPAAAAEEQTSFNVELIDAGANKIGVIKVVREVTAKGLKEAKDLVDGAPKVVKEGASKKEADEIKAKLEAAGAKVVLK